MIRNFGPALLLLTGQSDGFGLFGRPSPSRGGDVTRGPFEDMLRQMANDFKGLSGRMQGSLKSGRCALRETNQCCIGSDWNCQAPGSICSCDQMCTLYDDCCSDYEDLCSTYQEAECNLDVPDYDIAMDEPAKIPQDHRVGRASGDPHYHTFDGKTVHYQGGCIYRLTGLCDFAKGTEVEGHKLTEFVVYGKNRQQFKDKARSDMVRPMAWVQEVIVEIPVGNDEIGHAKQFIMIDQENKVRIAMEYADGWTSVENIERSRLPFTLTDLSGSRVGIIYERGNFVRVQVGMDGLTVGFNGKQNMRVHLPCQYNGNVCGLFGNSNNNPLDDNIMPNGQTAETENELGMSWVSSDFPVDAGLDADECSDEANLGHLDPEEICSQDQLREAATYCKPLMDTSGPFAACHDDLPPAEYFEDCVYDLCLFFENNLDHTEAMCELYSSYAGECRDVGIDGFSWRGDVDGCSVTCSGMNQAFFDELDFEETCIETIPVAEGGVIEGCFCASGYVRDTSGTSSTFGECISTSDCPPLQNSQLFAPPSIKNDEANWQHNEINLIDFNDLNPLNCLNEPARAIMDPVKGGFNHHAPSNWIKPDACCDDKPYNTGVEGCCGGRHLYDFNDDSCVGGQIVSRL